MSVKRVWWCVSRFQIPLVDLRRSRTSPRLTYRGLPIPIAVPITGSRGLGKEGIPIVKTVSEARWGAAVG
jgi:hypothetical protein